MTCSNPSTADEDGRHVFVRDFFVQRQLDVGEGEGGGKEREGGEFNAKIFFFFVSKCRCIYSVTHLSTLS